MKPHSLKILLSALIAGAGFAALAQTPPPPPEPPMHHGGAMGHHMGRMDPAKMQAMHAKHMAEFKARLKITPAQEASWNSFSDAMKPPAKPMDRPDHAALDKLTTPERIDKMREFRAKHMAERQAAMEQRENAIKTFYASLSDEQKKVMDAEHQRMKKAMEKMREHRGEPKKPPTPPTPPAAPAGK